MRSTAQRISLARPVVEATDDGARSLADAYWLEVRRLTAGLVRARTSGSGVELRLAGRLALFRFGPPTTSVATDRVECRLAIAGGLLAKHEGGALVFTQRSSPALELEVSVVDYVPRLSSVRPRRSLRHLVYRQVQERVHTAIGRRYLARMEARAR